MRSGTTLAEPQRFQRNARRLPEQGVPNIFFCLGVVTMKIWELNSKGPAFSVPKPWGPQKWLFCSLLHKL